MSAAGERNPSLAPLDAAMHAHSRAAGAPVTSRPSQTLFLNVDCRFEAEELLRCTKNGVDFEILISLFATALEGTAT
jgi:hypothetical protein